VREPAQPCSAPTPSAATFDFVFLDPPYAAAEEYERVLRVLGSASFLAPGSVIIAEHHKKFDLPVHAGSLARFRVLKQGDAALSFYRFTPAA
jgi:16S rRNA (guanine966-N2)-methyltransferase